MLAWLLACTPGEPPARVTYTGQARAVLDEHCATCHFAGGNTPFPLTTYAEAAPLAPMLAEAVSSGTMPPWPPDPSCREYRDERLLDPADVAILEDWAAAGAPEGRPDDRSPVEPPPQALEAYTDAARVPDFTPDLGADDVYRCFVLDLSFERDRFVTATSLTPGSPPVHHVLVYAVTGEQRALVEEADAADPAEGYPCAGSPFPIGGEGFSLDGLFDGELPMGGGFPNQLAGWAPGGRPVELDAGVAYRVDAGSLVVMQVHYSALGGTPVPDATELRLRITDEPPAEVLRTTALLVYDLEIPAGESPVVVTDETPYYASEPLELRSFAGHMHLLGTRVAGARIAPDGQEECLLDIPDWDFHWQGAYEALEPVIVSPGDRLRLTCEYDNSAANQPLVDGEPQEPQDVTFGEDTLDEMCLLYLARIEAYVPAPPGLPCAGTAGCVEACAGDWDCTTRCAEAEPACGSCLSSAVPVCAPACAITLMSDLECAEDCIMNSALLGGSTSMCLAGECPLVHGAFAGCMEDVVADGTCEAAFAECGL